MVRDEAEVAAVYAVLPARTRACRLLDTAAGACVLARAAAEAEAEFQDRPVDNRNLLHHRGCAEKLYLPCPAQYLLRVPEGSHKIRFLRSQRLRLLRISLCSSFLFDLLVSTLIE